MIRTCSLATNARTTSSGSSSLSTSPEDALRIAALTRARGVPKDCVPSTASLCTPVTLVSDRAEVQRERPWARGCCALYHPRSESWVPQTAAHSSAARAEFPA